jgi:5'-3' exonuclease
MGMGIPYYVASLLRTHKHIQQETGNVPLECDALGLDFNAFIHTYLKPEHPIGSVVMALRNFLRDVARGKKVLIAFDGLVPYAKIVQQRYRRMKNPEPSLFDKNQISPGTEFMKELEDTLRYCFPECILSGTDEPGEGEHKIFTWLRKMQPDERKNILIYGMDADLVLISVAQSELGSIKLIRENRDSGYSTFDVSALCRVLPLPPEDWVEMCVLCFGNDFMPTIAMFSLREDGYGRAVHYMKTQSLEGAADDELKVLMKRAKETDRRIVSRDGHAIESRMALHLMDGVLDWSKVVHAFEKTLEWTLHYFKTSEVLDWCWTYPYPEAPLLAALVEKPRNAGFTWDHPTPPFTIEDQLNFILPGRGVFPDELYEEGPDSRHPWMKSYSWETDPYISLPWNPMQAPTRVQTHLLI